MVAAADRPLDAREALLAAAHGTRATESGGKFERVTAEPPPEIARMPKLCDALPLLGTSCTARLPAPPVGP
jgi:hypothetical protein